MHTVQGGDPRRSPRSRPKAFSVRYPVGLQNDAHRIERKFKFRNFGEALRFVTQVGELAEAEGHHPDISFGWGHAEVSLETKKIKGLHENDFIMAAKIDRLGGQKLA